MEEPSYRSVANQGDYIGQGQSRTFTPNDSQFSSMVSQENREIAVSVFPPGSFWYLHMAAPAGQQLLPGVYQGATRWPFQEPSTPGLDFLATVAVATHHWTIRSFGGSLRAL
jgi:hypothetical protein